MNSKGDYAIPYLAKKNSFAVAISGGGTRSASAAIGQLRAINELGWIEKAKYMSASSGGAWALVPYLYKSDSISDEEFLGEYVAPEDLTERLIRKKGIKKSLGNAIHTIGFVFPQVFTQGLRGNEAYGKTIGKYFLKPFGIESSKFFTFDDKAYAIVSAKQNEKVNEVGFSSVSKSRELPYPIVTATGFPDESGGWDSIYPIEITPLYSGIRTLSIADKIGGGYIESFAYDASFKTELDPKKTKMASYTIKNKASRFSLNDVVGVTGAAPVQALESTRFTPNANFPKFNYEPVGEVGEVSVRKLTHGDGGFNDNLALFPLFNRRVENILVFINTSTKFEIQAQELIEMKDASGFEGVSGDLVSYFAISDEDKRYARSYHPHRFPYNAVINNGEAKLKSLVDEFNKLQSAGKPLVHCDRYTIRSSERYGLEISGSYEPNICWVYLDRSQRWADAIKPGKKDKQLSFLVPENSSMTGVKKQKSRLFQTNNDFVRFPHYRTIGESWIKAIDLSAPQVNAISQLTHWSVLRSSEKIESFLNLND